MLVFSPLLTNLIVFYGWRTALRILACGVLVTGIAGGVLHTNPPVQEDDTIKTKTPIEITANSSGNGQVQMNEMCKVFDELNATSRELEDERPNEKSICIEDNNPNDDSQVVKHGVGILHMVTHIDPWIFTVASILALLGWTFFTVNLVSTLLSSFRFC